MVVGIFALTPVTVADILALLQTENTIQAVQALLTWVVISGYGSLVMRCALRYIRVMIKSFKHKGLRKFYQSGSVAGIQPKHAKRLRMQLAAIDTAQSIDDIDLPGFALHTLGGRREGQWSISVSGNWRITFEFFEGNAYILNYEDYH